MARFPIIALAAAWIMLGAQAAVMGAGAEPSTEITHEFTQGIEPGQQPPDFTATDLQGQSHHLRDIHSKPVLVHFWATWCPYCRAEIPKIKKLQEQWGSKGALEIITISVDEDLDKVKKFLAAQPLPYPVIADVSQRPALAELYHVEGIPASYLIDRDGLIANRFEGQADLISAVRRLVGEAPKP